MSRTFGTVLRSQSPKVEADFHKFAAAMPTKIPITLPKNFDGRVVWKDYLSSINSQGKCGDCFAEASTSALADKFAIQSLGQIKVDLSSASMAICEEVNGTSDTFKAEVESMAKSQEINEKSHAAIACMGNTLYNAARHLYIFGVPKKGCGDSKDMSAYKILQDYTAPSDIPVCQSIYGLARDHCIDNSPMRVYRAAYAFSIAADPSDGGYEDVAKYEIYRFGPVIAGFQVFSDFMNGYDGTTIYTHPDANAQNMGGHAVSLLGWGTELQDGKEIDYWIVRNSWGISWGENGFFKIQRNIQDCQLEKNIVTVVPKLPGLNNIINIAGYSDTLNTGLIQQSDDQTLSAYQVDEDTGYPMTIYNKIKSGEVKGDLTPLLNKSVVPDFGSFYAGKISQYPMYQDYLSSGGKLVKKTFYSSYKYYILILLALAGVGVYIWYRRRKMNRF